MMYSYVMRTNLMIVLVAITAYNLDLIVLIEGKGLKYIKKMMG